MAAVAAETSRKLKALEKELPVVNNLFTDHTLTRHDQDTKQILPKLPAPGMDKVLKLLKDKHSGGLTQRHKICIKRLVNHYSDGFYLKDLETVTEIIVTCKENINIDSVYESCVVDLMKCLRWPFFKENMSDEEAYLGSAVNCISRLGHHVESCGENIICSFAGVLGELYAGPSERPKSPPTGTKAVSSGFLKTVVQRSRACYSLSNCLSQMNSLNGRVKIMENLRLLSDSVLNCDDMLAAGVAGAICNYMNFADPSRKLLFLTVEILWNLIENGSKEEVMEQLNCKECIDSLKGAFIAQTQGASSLADCQIRNDLLTLTSLVIVVCPKAPFVETGLAHLLALMASYPEVASKSDLVKNLKLYEKHEDFELKKMLFNVLVALSNENAAVQIMVDQRVPLALFHYIRPIDSTLHTHWTIAQFEELQLLALSVLSSLAPLFIEEFLTLQGNTRLLLMLEWCLSIDAFGGHGNSFFGTGGRGSKRAQMRYVLRLIRSVVSTFDDHILQDLVDQGGINQFVSILHNATSSTDENDSIDIEMQCDMLFILATLCEGDSHRKELFGEQGVQVLINYLKTPREKLVSVHGDRFLVLASVDCLWSAVLGCYLNEMAFLEREGLFLLLDNLEHCPSNMQSLILGAILDFSENPKAIPHINTWRGKDELTAAKLMVNLWKEEEDRLEVQKNELGTIKDPSCPILSKIQERQGIIPLPSTCPSPAIVDVSENLRAKIYAFFCKTGFNNIAGLQTSDYVTLAVIEQYLEFKTLEVWKEVKTELAKEGIRPVSPDIESMDHIIRVLEERADSVASVQGMLIDAEAKQELAEEGDWHQKVMDSHMQEEKAYQTFVSYVQRTSDFHLLKKARREQLNLITHSRLLSCEERDKEETFHPTTSTVLNTTTFCNRHIAVQSTPAEILKRRRKTVSLA